MTLPVPLMLRGVPGSPYTRKMLALLRYRHIPYRLLLGNQESQQDLPQPKVNLLPTFYLPNASGELEAVVDSTPLIRRFEAEFDGRSVIPTNPAMAFIDYLLEDFGDEWLTKAMFHYRWYYQDDIDKAGSILPRWAAIDAPEAQMLARKQFIAERQISRLYVVGSNDTTAPVIEASYQRFLALFKTHLENQAFLLGQRPASSDFAFYAQLTQLAQFDPTPMALTLKEAPRVYAWTDVMDDLSGLEPQDSDWQTPDTAQNTLRDLLIEVGRGYAPVMRANAEALMQGLEQVELTVDDKPWVQQPFPYQGRCLQWLRERYDALDAGARDEVDTLLAGTGCEVLFA